MIKGELAVRQELNGLEKKMSDILDAENKAIRLKKLQASHHCLEKYMEVLKQATFVNLDVKEWIIENDLLVNRLKEDDSQASVQKVMENFTSLLDRVQGIPPDTSFICYEQAIAYNLSHLLLQGHTNVGGLHKSATFLCQSIYRAFEAFRIEHCHQGEMTEPKDFTNLNLFSPANTEYTLDTLLPALFKELFDRSIGCGPLVLSCCLLAFLWLLDEEVSQAVKLLHLMQSQLECLELNTNSAEEVPAVRFPVCLFSLEYIPSITNYVITSSTTSTKDLTDIQSLLSVVTSLLAFAHFANKEYDKVLETLEGKEQTHDVGFNDLYLKGYILYEQNKVDDALACFEQCLSISQGQDRAAALNMLGCCCAEKGKHHTAVAKFKDALEHDFQQLEALFNTSLQYQKLGNITAEIKALNLLKQVIKSRENEQQRCYDVAVIPRGHNSDRNKSKLDVELCVPPRFSLGGSMSSAGMSKERVTYILAKRYSELGRFEEAAKNFLELLANIVDMRTTSFCNARNLPGPTELYKQCAFALLKAGRYEDAVTVCDKVLTTVEHLQPAEKGQKDETRANDKAPKKRLRPDDEEDFMSSTDKETVSDDIQMLVLKAESLVHLQKPLEALQSLNRVLKALEDVQSVSYHTTNQGDKDNEGQQRKRRKVECEDDVSSEVEQSQGRESSKLVRVKVQAYNQKASILEGLGQTQDALHQLHLSLECLPEHPETVYKHTQLLLNLGSHKEAVLNWLRFRGIRERGGLDSIRKGLSSSITKFLESDVTIEQVREMDELALKWWSDYKYDDPFYPHARVL